MKGGAAAVGEAGLVAGQALSPRNTLLLISSGYREVVHSGRRVRSAHVQAACFAGVVQRPRLPSFVIANQQPQVDPAF